MLRHLAGTSLLALALATSPALAQAPIPDKAEGYGDSSGIDTLVTDDAPAPVAAAKTGDPVLDRLNELEAKVARLEARNKELEEKAAFTEDRVQKVEVRAAKSVQPGPAPTFSDVAGNFTFKPRGTIQIDYAGYNERAGGYDYNNGTDIRRARFGFDGTAYKNFKYRIEAEYVKGTVNLLDAYVSYGGVKNWVFTIGQQKAPYGLEANTSDSFNTFLERGMANNAFGAVGAERRVGVTAAYVTDKLNATIGIFGTGEAVQRSTNPTTPDEGYSGNARVTWDPILDTGKVVHLGVSGFRATNFGGNSLTISDRPNTRVDGGQIVSAAIAGTAPVGGPATGAKTATFYGGEAAVVFGPFSAQGEYGRLHIDRFGAAPSVDFDGFYVFGSYFLTGESRVFKNGVVDRQKPFADFDPSKGDWGAIELAVRYDQLDLTDTGLSPLDKKATSWTGALNWYLNGNTKLLFNYIRFKGENSPLVVAPVLVNGTTAKGDAFATRLHFDF
jgi:phosphate-selective porin OprO/OprP